MYGVRLCEQHVTEELSRLGLQINLTDFITTRKQFVVSVQEIAPVTAAGLFTSTTEDLQYSFYTHNTEVCLKEYSYESYST